jgi:DNA-binding MarR family transcriptional regulator
MSKEEIIPKPEIQQTILSQFGEIAIARYSKPTHAGLLLSYIAECCNYENNLLYNPRKRSISHMLRRTGIKHKTEYQRAFKKLLELGLIKKYMNAKGGPYVIYRLTERSVGIAEDFWYKINKDKSVATSNQNRKKINAHL